MDALSNEGAAPYKSISQPSQRKGAPHKQYLNAGGRVFVALRIDEQTRSISCPVNVVISSTSVKSLYCTSYMAINADA